MTDNPKEKFILSAFDFSLQICSAYSAIAVAAAIAIIGITVIIAFAAVIWVTAAKQTAAVAAAYKNYNNKYYNPGIISAENSVIIAHIKYLLS